MTMNGKREGFTRGDFDACAKAAGMKRGRAGTILDEVIAAVKDWPRFAIQAKLSESTMSKIQKVHLLDFPKK
jgi:serine/threonine-protein kinase HipA